MKPGASERLTFWNLTCGAAKYLTCPTAIARIQESAKYRLSGYIVYNNVPLSPSFGYNAYFQPAREAKTILRKLSQWRRGAPSEILVLADSWRRVYIENSSDALLIIESDPTRASIKGLKAHSGGANVLFADGHIAMTNELSGKKIFNRGMTDSLSKISKKKDFSMRRILCCLFLLFSGVTCFAQSAPGRVVADSVVDWDKSAAEAGLKISLQGANSWFFGYYPVRGTPSSFKAFPPKTDKRTTHYGDGNFTTGAVMRGEICWASGKNAFEVVRRWIVPEDGIYFIHVLLSAPRGTRDFVIYVGDKAVEKERMGKDRKEFLFSRELKKDETIDFTASKEGSGPLAISISISFRRSGIPIWTRECASAVSGLTPNIMCSTQIGKVRGSVPSPLILPESSGRPV